MGDYLTEQNMDENLSGIEAKPMLPVDNNTHHSIYAHADSVYNSRLFLGNITTHLFDGWALRYSNNPGSGSRLFTRVTIQTGEGVKTADTPLFQIGTQLNLPLIISYPDSRATRIDFFSETSEPASSNVKISGGKSSILSLPLTPHPFLNIAYAINPECAKGIATDPILINPLSMCRGNYLTSCLFTYSYSSSHPIQVYTDNMLNDINRVQVSELSNPLYFPAKHSNQVGDKEVLGFSANTIPLSQGQFGQHPMLVFTQSGMWAMQLGVDPFVQAIIPLNGEVTTDKKSIVSIGEATVFKTGEGLKLIKGSEITNLSDSIKLLDNVLLDDTTSGIEYITNSPIVGPTAAIISKVSFLEYLKEAIIGFDNTHRELLVANPAYQYVYALSFKHNYWYKLYMNGSKVIADYPDFYFINNLGVVYQLNSETETNKLTYLQTRPIDIEKHGFIKLKRTILRGILNTDGSSAKEYGFYLFASVDGKKWAALTGTEVGGTVRDIILNRQLPSAKYLIVVASGVLRPDSFITSISVDDEDRLSNRLR